MIGIRGAVTTVEHAGKETLHISVYSVIIKVREH
jgi:hypothetical protein